MAPPKRKAPSKGKSRRKPQQSLASRGATAFGTLGMRGAGALGTVSLRGAGMLGGAVGRHPSIAGGAMAFGVIFSFVATNALWYQPGVHPSPLFRTRDPASPYAIFGRKTFFHDAGDVTTFRIERPDGQPAKPAAPNSVASVIAAASAPAAANGNAGTMPAPPAASAAAPQGNLVSQVQTALAHRGFYQGAADGVVGPHTTSAISAYQQSAGLKQTGEATPELLASLQSASRPNAAVPVERPADVSSKSVSIDPVAAAIMSAEKSDKDVKTASVAPSRKPLPTPPAPVGDPIANINMVMQIQKGLTNIAYSNVTIDGVAGETTRQAILHFQKHYRLPETGVPDMTVLKKLKDIGAL